jgi:predicted  nucleic acid-binding Zn-ribbon protein
MNNKKFNKAIDLLTETAMDAGKNIAKKEIDALRSDLARVREERDGLRKTYNNLRMQIENVNQVYWEYDDWGDKVAEMKESLEAILVMFPEALESEDEMDIVDNNSFKDEWNPQDY